MAQSDPLSPEKFQQLREDVEALGAVFNVDRRGEYHEALRVYTEGLRVDAFDLESQSRAAEIEIMLGSMDSAYERLLFITARAEDGSDT